MDEVGVISLGVKVNQNGLNQGLNEMKKTVDGSASNVLSGIKKAFATVAVGGFLKSCLDLGSNLTEVQNVVDTTFGSMSNQINAWSKNAMEQFGLSETVAKKYAGTFGSMAKAFDITGQAGVEMSESIAGLTGDVASFYNLSTDEAYTKLKSIFTGETESLKELGVVMTQTALDQYAMNNGFGKTTKNMTEQEKVMLRYQFVMSRLSDAQGDFARTSGSWANQTRVLKLRIDAIRASIGQGLINVLTPVIRLLNELFAKIQVVADAFAKFTAILTGSSANYSSNNSGLAQATTATQNTASSAEDTATAINNANKSSGALADTTAQTTKNLKEATRFLAGFDAINKISTSNDTTDTTPSSGSNGGLGDLGGSGLGGGGGVFDTSNAGGTNGALDDFAKKLQKIKEIASDVANLFKSGFLEGIGGDYKERLANILGHLSNIKASLVDIFTDPEVVNASVNLSKSIVENLGKITGAVASIGITIAENLTGGLDKYLSENSDYIKNKLVKIFDARAEIWEIAGDFAVAFADVFSVFGGENAQNITKNIISIFATSYLNIEELTTKLTRDILNLLTKPFIDNKDVIKTALDGTLGVISKCLDTIEQAVKDYWETIQNVYDKHIKPLLDSVANGISEIVGTVVDGYNKYMLPALNNLADKFRSVYDSTIKPTLDKVGEAVGGLFDSLKRFWETVLQPLINWIAEILWPVISPIVDLVGTVLINAFGGLIEMLGNGATGLIAVVKAPFDAISSIVDFISKSIDSISNAWNALKSGEVTKKVTILKDKAFDSISNVWNDIKNSDAVKTIKGAINTTWNSIKSAWSDIKNSDAWKTIKGSIHSGFNTAKNAWNGLKSASIVKTIKGSVNSGFNTAKNAWNGLKSKTISLATKLPSANSIKNSMVSIFKSAANAVVNVFNSLVNRINSMLHIKWSAVKVLGKTIVPGVNVQLMKIPSIPKLAEGGYIKANTPQLAMIGDNTRQGEIVAPESKLLEMARIAAESGSNTEVVTLLAKLIDIVERKNLSIDGKQITRAVINNIKSSKKSTGYNPLS